MIDLPCGTTSKEKNNHYAWYNVLLNHLPDFHIQHEGWDIQGASSQKHTQKNRQYILYGSRCKFYAI